jgi:glycerol-3-phosphate dehydrogenase
VTKLPEFSFRTREQSLAKMRAEVFDFLVIGGGITGVSVARDAASRGLKVALVEREDYAYGTSSRSSKLIHGGLRYLENLEFDLVFESLSERAFLLKSVPHLVKPLPFLMPVYQGDRNGRFILSLGLWLYDLLSLFRSPKIHRFISRKDLLKRVPGLKEEGLQGGFEYFDASMWDDALTVETARAASAAGACLANYVEAVEAHWENERVQGFRVRDRHANEEFCIRAKQVILCGGPWTDLMGERVHRGWRRLLTASKGVHLIFDLKRLPVPGTVVMNHPEDKRIAFVIPRPDMGNGAVLVGTTDGPVDADSARARDPDSAQVTQEDIDYLMGLLQKYFPGLNLTEKDIVSAYVGVRPLVGEPPAAEGAVSASASLQKVTREHHIDRAVGDVVVVAGGKYTTHRTMAQEVVDFAIKTWAQAAPLRPEQLSLPPQIRRPNTRQPINPLASSVSKEALPEDSQTPKELLSRYGNEAREVLNLRQDAGREKIPSPPGFPELRAQLLFSIRNEMVLHLHDFYLRRQALALTRADGGLPWAQELAELLCQEQGRPPEQVSLEVEWLQRELSLRSGWKKTGTVQSSERLYLNS